MTAERIGAIFRAFGRAVTRAGLILVSGTVVGHVLAHDGLASYFSRIGDIVAGDTQIAGADLTDMAVETLILAGAGLVFGVIIGWAVARVLRGRAGRALGFVTGPTLAIVIPGVVFVPAVWLLVRHGVAVEGPIPSDGSLWAEIRHLAPWSMVVGLSIAPAVAAMTSGTAAASLMGLSEASAGAAARPFSAGLSNVGVPTTTFLLALTVAEIMSGHPGLIGSFAAALGADDPTTAFELLVVIVACGAALAFVAELLGSVSRFGLDGGRSLERRPSVRTSPLFIPVFLALAALVGVAGAGYSLGDLSSDGVAGAGPTIGGPWFGTDQLGVSLAERVAVALGPALVATAIPALLAVAVAGLVVAVSLTIGPRWWRLPDIAVDALWWPIPLVVMLAQWQFESPDGGPRLHPGTLALTGLCLTPLAFRLLRRRVTATVDRLAVRTMSVGFTVAALALAVHVVAGLVEPVTAGRVQTLGQLLAGQASETASVPWPLVAPAVTVAVVASLIYWLAATVAAPIAAPAVEPAQPTTFGVAEPTATMPVPQAPPLEQELAPDGPGLWDSVTGSEEPPAGGLVAVPLSEARPGPAFDLRAEADPDFQQTEAEPFEEFPMADAASKTIELRPSMVRRSERDQAVIKPVLAPRPPQPPPLREPHELDDPFAAPAGPVDAEPEIDSDYQSEEESDR